MAMKFDHKWKKLPLPRFTYSQLYVIWKKGEDMLVYRIWIKYKEIAFGRGPEIRWLHVSKEALQKKKKSLEFLLLRKVKGRGFEHNSKFISLRNQ